MSESFFLPENGDWMMYSTPFWSKGRATTPRPERHTLTSILVLRKGQTLHQSTHTTDVHVVLCGTLCIMVLLKVSRILFLDDVPESVLSALGMRLCLRRKASGMATESNAYVKYYEKVQTSSFRSMCTGILRIDAIISVSIVISPSANPMSCLAEAEALFDELAKPAHSLYYLAAETPL